VAREVAGRLTWTRREYHRDSLWTFDATLAVYETVAHLDVLLVKGGCAAATSRASITSTRSPLRVIKRCDLDT
jgi:hypothetical protein